MRAEYAVPSLSGVYDDDGEIIFHGSHDGLRGLGDAASLLAAKNAKEVAKAFAAGQASSGGGTATGQGGGVGVSPIVIVGAVVAIGVAALLLSKKKK